jgi:hypothetical protein
LHHIFIIKNIYDHTLLTSFLNNLSDGINKWSHLAGKYTIPPIII